MVRYAIALLSLAVSACGAQATESNETPDAGVRAPAPVDAMASGTTDGTPAPLVPTFRVMVFNINHADTATIADIAAVITSADPDIVGLIDVDLTRMRSGKVDQATVIATATGLTKRFFSEITVTNDGSTGNAILTKFPIKASGKIMLPNQGGQQRILGWTDLEIDGKTVKVGVTHLGEYTAAERLAQAQTVTNSLAGIEWAVLAGDLADSPASVPVTTIGTKLFDQWPRIGTEPQGLTFPSTNLSLRRDYVFASNAFVNPIAGKTVASTTSDHLPVFVDLPLPGP